MKIEAKDFPAFPLIEHDQVLTEGMTLRDYFIAHAPVEPHPWFKPEMSVKSLEPPVFPVDADDHFREFYDVIKPEDAKTPAQKEYLIAKRQYDSAMAARSAEYGKQRYIQWPAAWADAMLEARES